VAVNVRTASAEALAKEIGERAFAVPGDVAAIASPTIRRRTVALDESTSSSTMPRFRCRHASPSHRRRMAQSDRVNLTAVLDDKPFFRQCAPSTTAASLISRPQRADGERARWCTTHIIEAGLSDTRARPQSSASSASP
jgi:hypothetical protein